MRKTNGLPIWKVSGMSLECRPAYLIKLIISYVAVFDATINDLGVEPGPEVDPIPVRYTCNLHLIVVCLTSFLPTKGLGCTYSIHVQPFSDRAGAVHQDVRVNFPVKSTSFDHNVFFYVGVKTVLTYPTNISS
jgi:hypothetical protein